MDSDLKKELAAIREQLSILTERFEVQVNEYLSNQDAQQLLQKTDDWFNKRIDDGNFIRGLHFTGDRKSRYWRRSRILRWIETQDSPDKRMADHKKWFRELK